MQKNNNNLFNDMFLKQMQKKEANFITSYCYAVNIDKCNKLKYSYF